MEWSPASWRRYEARQLPAYPDPAALAAAERVLAARPTLTDPADSDRLLEALAEAQAGRAFLLQGGDCAESFADYSAGTTAATHALMEGMARMIAAASGLPVVRLGRIAGQFAKPRSADTERAATDGAPPLPAYRGDIVNSIALDAGARRPDPARMLRAYDQSAGTLARLVALADAAGAPFHASHEALLLPYEEALTRRRPDGRHHAGSAHFLWVGHRTRFPGSAHVEYARGIANPIGLKCGPGLTPDALLRLIETLDPDGVPGRLTLIARMGAARVGALLPPLMRAAAGRPVLWACDPMHGNTITAANGYKTRPLDAILAETRAFFAIAAAEGARAGGFHVEMTGRDVTECTGGAVPVTERDLAGRYHTQCDPRLNPGQAMELAALVADTLSRRRRAA